ncbi:uncharacterized protein LOC113172170 [Anabas testudineus]|uniref:uncharacterized protein LOC113172170 n=1 Tax=Anabas testudineus TaxID=64144 RepID=UPI000E4572A5|nr:uncharacterized protein LOC113172170 [Anabas testudineus]XP_026230808.1 uncharacterized protein LOC113172170 [Anabas testudineus]
MEESYETFEEELGPPRADPPPQKPVRQISRPEMYATRKIREEMARTPQQPEEEFKTLPNEPTLTTTASLHKTSSVQNLTQMETPWENVTLNRCLFVAITILVLASGFQKLHETLRGQGTGEDEEVGLRVRRSGTLRHRGKPPEPETSLWEVMFWWLPDLDDEEEEEDEEDDDDDDKQVRRGRSMKGAAARASRGFRNKPLPDKNILKQKGRKLKDRRAMKAWDEEIKRKKRRDKEKEFQQAADDEEPNNGDDEDENGADNEEVPKKSRKLKKEKRKSQKG